MRRIVGDSVVLETGPRTDVVGLADVRAIAVRARSTGRGAAIGAITLGTVGAALGVSVAAHGCLFDTPCKRESTAGFGLVGGMAAALVGGALGAGVGFLWHHWEPVAIAR